MATRQRAVELLNEAKTCGDKDGKAKLLEQVVELVVRKEPQLLAEFLTDLCELHIDPLPSVRRLAAGIVEEAASVAQSMPQLQQCLASLTALVQDGTAAVVKRSIGASTSVHRTVVDRLAAAPGPSPEAAACWEQCSSLKQQIYHLAASASSSGAVRLMAVKFLETAIMLYTAPELLHRAGAGHPYLSPEALNSEAQSQAKALGQMLKPLHGATSHHLPNQVLLVAMQSMGDLAKQRPQFFPLVSEAFHSIGASGMYEVGSGPSPRTSVAHALKKALIEMLRAKVAEAQTLRGTLVEALECIGANDAAAEAVRKAEKSAKRDGAVREKQGRRTRMEEDDGPQAPQQSAAAPAAQETGPEEISQVVTLLAVLLEKGDHNTMRGFVEQLPPGVLVDVVLSNMDHLPTQKPPDVTGAGPGAGLAGLLAHIKGGAAPKQQGSQQAGVQEPTPVPEDRVVGVKDETKADIKPQPAAPARPPAQQRVVPPIPSLAPLELRPQAISGLQRVTVKRILSSVAGADASHLTSLRAGLLSKLATLGKPDQELEATLLDAILSRPTSASLELASRWLHCLFAQLCEEAQAEAEALEEAEAQARAHAEDEAPAVAEDSLMAVDGHTDREETAAEPEPEPAPAPEAESDPSAMEVEAPAGAAGEERREESAAGFEEGNVKAEDNSCEAPETTPAGTGDEPEQSNADAPGGSTEPEAAAAADGVEGASGTAQGNSSEAPEATPAGTGDEPEQTTAGATGESTEPEADAGAVGVEEGNVKAEENSCDAPETTPAGAGDEPEQRKVDAPGESTEPEAEAAAEAVGVEEGDEKAEGNSSEAPEATPAGAPGRDQPEQSNADAPGESAAPEAAAAAETPQTDNNIPAESLETVDATGAGAIDAIQAAGVASEPMDRTAGQLEGTDLPPAPTKAAVSVTGSRYEEILVKLLTGLRDTSDPKDTLVLRLLQMAPALSPATTAEFLTSTMNLGPQWAVVALKGAWELLTNSPALRKACLSVVLTAASSRDADIRQKGVRLTANRLFPDRRLMADIERYALDTLTGKGQQLGPEGETEQTAAGMAYRCELYMALCTRKHTMLKGLLEAFVAAAPSLRQAIHKQAKDLALTVGMSSKIFLAVVRFPPQGSELLLLQMLHVQTEEKVPPPELVSAILDLYELTGDARFIPPAIPGMAKDDVLDFLPHILTLEARPFQAALSRLLDPRQGAAEAVLTPSELLVNIHAVEAVPAADGGPTLEQIKAGITACLNHRRLFTKEALALTLQSMKDMTPLPRLFMWTVIHMSRAASELGGFILQQLREITYKVWNAQEQWQGFVMCCKIMAPASLQLMAELTPEMLSSASRRLPATLLDKLIAYLQSPANKLPQLQARRAIEAIEEAKNAPPPPRPQPQQPKPNGSSNAADSGGSSKPITDGDGSRPQQDTAAPDATVGGVKRERPDQAVGEDEVDVKRHRDGGAVDSSAVAQ